MLAASATELWTVEIESMTDLVTALVRDGVEETNAVLGTTSGGPGARLARLRDLARSSVFRWAEGALHAGERLNRLILTAALLPSTPVLLLPRQLLLAAVAADVWLGYRVLRERSRWWPGLVHAEDWELQHHRGAARVHESAVALGGLLIKAGQMASVRPDLIPGPYVERLSGLQDRVPPRPWITIERAITTALRRPLPEVFQEIEAAPIAAASLAQVHRALLRDGRPVAVKVQYPEVAELVAADIAALGPIADVIGRIEPTVRLGAIVEALRITMPRELDFAAEAASMARLRAALSHRSDVVIPTVIEELSSERLIVMEFMEGIKVTDREALIGAGIEPGAVARLINDAYAEQILATGLLHGDPHPGNLLVQPGPRLVLLDHGLTIPVPASLGRALARAVAALGRGDFEAVLAALRDAGLEIDEQVDLTALLALAGVVFGDAASRPVPDSAWRLGVSVGHIPVELILIGRALGLIDGITRQLDPSVDALEAVMRYATPA
jgi:predicted unusual protein kinase regulating ubiquinone biosynthesis (AarF/ABC1/UbiB family)